MDTRRCGLPAALQPSDAPQRRVQRAVGADADVECLLRLCHLPGVVGFRV
jgi:hypothetical protein